MSFYLQYSIAIAGFFLAAIFIFIGYRFNKFRVNKKDFESNNDFSDRYPTINTNVFLPTGWSIQQDEDILQKCIQDKTTYLGWSKVKALISGYNAEPVIIKDKDRTYHCQVVGTTGSGKTEILLNMIAQDIMKGYGCCIVDPKADDDFRDKLLCHAKACGYSKDVYFFSLMYPDKSHVYNPVQNGTPEEITERIINAASLEVEYYRNIQYVFLRNAIIILRTIHDFITLTDIIAFMQNFEDNQWVADNIVAKAKSDISVYLRECLKLEYSDVSGILSILIQITSGIFGSILNNRTQIDLKNIINNGKIVYFQLPVMKYGVIGKALGKMILQDIQSIVGSRQSTSIDPEFTVKNFYPCYFDEFYSLAYPGFVELINKARSANVAIHLGHQSLADLAQVSKEFKEAVFENTNIKLISKQNDAASCEEFAKSFGTRMTTKTTHAVQKGLFFDVSTSSSLREVDEFIIHPNMLKNAKTGQGVIKCKSEQAKPCQYRMFSRWKNIGPFSFDMIPKRKEGLLMKLLLLLLLLVSLLFGARFNRDEILSLSHEERMELMQKLPPNEVKALADSLTIWGSMQAMERAQLIIKSYPQELTKIKETMDKAISSLQAQVGFSLIYLVVSFILQLILGILMYRKVRTVSPSDDPKSKTTIKGRKFYLLWIISTISVFGVYAFITSVAF